MDLATPEHAATTDVLPAVSVVGGLAMAAEDQVIYDRFAADLTDDMLQRLSNRWLDESDAFGRREKILVIKLQANSHKRQQIRGPLDGETL